MQFLFCRKIFQEKDAFVGFNDDTCASIVIQLLQADLNYSPEQVDYSFFCQSYAKAVMFQSNGGKTI